MGPSHGDMVRRSRIRRAGGKKGVKLERNVKKRGWGGG